jgi:hypothetical protein
MKRAVRTIVLVVGIVCSCLAMATPVSVKTANGPMPLCGPDFPPPHCNPAGLK